MKTLTWCPRLVCILLMLTTLNLCAKATEDTLGLIINMDDVLTQSPAQQAAVSLQNALSSPTKQAHNESKTSIFQQTFVKYVRDIYNKNGYEKVLSQNADHMVQFFELCREISLPPGTAYVCVRLFNNKLKSSELIDDTVVMHLLGNVPQLVDHYFAEEETQGGLHDLDAIKKQLGGMIIKKLSNHLGPTAKGLYPNAFAQELSFELTNFYKHEAEQIQKAMNRRHEAERLRNLLIRFFETCINKIMWEPKGESPWRSFGSIAQGIQNLAEYGVIDHMDDLDDLYWSLTHRFCYFLEIAGSVLPPETFVQIENDLDGRAVSFLEFKEQDDDVVSKKDTLLKAIGQAKIRALAFSKNGYRTNPLQGTIE